MFEWAFGGATASCARVSGKMKNSDVKLIENLFHNDDAFDVRWRVTTLCNYDCAFCIQGNRQEHLRQAKGESPRLRARICDEAIRLIEGLDKYKAVKIFLIGGELTILDDFPMIFEKLALCDFLSETLLDMTTNFSQDADYFCRLCDIVQTKTKGKKRGLTIRTSFYPDYTTERQFTEKLRTVYEYSGRNQRPDASVRFTVGAPILNDADYNVLLRLQSQFEDADVEVAPIFIRNYKGISKNLVQRP